MLLQDSSIALVGGWLDLRGEGRDGKSVGGIQGAAKEEALVVLQGDDGEKRMPAISCGKLVGEGGEKVVFAVNLIFYLC